MKGKFLNTKNVVIGLVSLVLIGASATGVTIFLKNRGQAEAAGEQVQNLPATGREEQDNNQANTNPGTAEDPNNQGNNTEVPGTPVEPTTPNTNPGTTTPNQTTGGTTTNTGGNNTTTGIEETVRMERQKVFEDLQLSWTTIGIPAITANMGIFKPELQIEKTATAVIREGEAEQIPVMKENKPMVRAGDTIIYTIQVSNLGNYKATNVVVTDSLDVIFDGKTVPANEELAKIETLEAGKVATLKVGYVVKQADIDAVIETEQNETISKDIINIATATDGKTTVEDNDEMPVNPDVTINVNKNWQDNDNQDGKRPEKITVELYRNNENEPVETVTIDASSDWKYVFNKLPKYDENKNEITYRVVEVTVPEYDTKYEISDNGVEIYNHHTPETTSISGRKTWNDSSNQDGVRPDSITVELLKTVDGTTTSMGDNYKRTLTGNTVDTVDYSWSDLPVYEAGKRITYTVKEVGETNGKIAGKNSKEYKVEYDSNGMNITNSYEPEKTEVSGRKTWNDNNNQDGIRPDSIEIQLYKTVNGTKTTMGDNYKVTLTSGDDKVWQDTELTYTWSKLPKYENGSEITYTVAEITEVNGYNTTYSEDTLTITNSHTPATIEKTTVTKVWDDADNQDGIRPDSIEIQLYKTVNGTKTTMGDNYKVTLTSGNDKVWQDAELTHTWEDLPQYENGSEITYTVAEITKVNGYKTTYSKDTLTITNSHTPATIKETTVTKVWIDEGKNRPNSIEIQLYKTVNGTKTAMGDSYKITLTSGDDKVWQDAELTHTWEDLPQYENGNEITYTVAEATVTGYDTSYSTDTFTITNTIEQETISLSGNKIWLDPVGTKHDTITLQVYQNNEPYKVNDVDYSIELADGATSFSFTGLPKYKVDSEGNYILANGKVQLNEYKVVETTGQTGYSVSYSTVTTDNDGNYTQNVTNSLEQTQISFTANKVWVDEGIVDNRKDITVELYKNNVATCKTLQIKKGEKTCTFDGLDRYTIVEENGEIKSITENIYSVQEKTTISGYDEPTYSEVAKDGAEWSQTITNTKTQEKISVEGTKTWKLVPEGTNLPKVEVKLLKDGKEVASTTVTNGKYSFTDLDKFDMENNYREYEYTVKEVVPEGYVATYDGYNITNTKHITATKSAVTSTGVDEVNIGETINYTITITNNTEVATEVTVQDNIPGLNQGNVKVEVNGDITLEGKPLTEVEVQALYNGTFKVNMPATATRTIVIPIKVTAGMTGDKIKNTAYVNAEPTNEVINPIERTVAVTRYKNNLSSTNIILVLDVSSSMKGEKIKTAKQAVIDFIEKTYKTEENKDVTFTLITFAKREYTEGARGDQQGKKYKYHGGLFEFNDSGENKGKYEYGCGNSIITLQNHEDFKTAFEGLLTDRGTNMRAGLEVAYNTIYGEAENTLSKLYPNYDKIVIFFGDGEPYGEEELKNNPAGIKEAAGWLKAKKAKVYSIGFGNGASEGTKGWERLKDISSDGNVYTSSNYTQLVKNFSDIVSADPVVYPYTIDGNAIIELTAETTQKIVVDEKNPIKIKIGDAEEILITDIATAEKYKITYTNKKIIWDVKEYSKDTNLRISYHVQ